MEPSLQWFEALEQRHLQTARFQDVRRGIQALSTLYVERRARVGRGTALDGAGKRAAFACYFAPVHFLLVREIVRALGAGASNVGTIVDLGCGTGSAGAAWALEIQPPARIIGVERNLWAGEEARWTFRQLGLRGSVVSPNLDTFEIPARAAVVAAFLLNEIPETTRDRLCAQFLRTANRGAPVLIVEPIAKRLLPWWESWTRIWTAAGGRSDEWRFPLKLPDRLAFLGKAAGLAHRDLRGRSLWLPG